MALSPGNHGVIVTHGIGDNMKPGVLLADFTNSLADALMESLENGGRILPSRHDWMATYLIEDIDRRIYRS